jgi:lipopolysaccharide transport system ATP-binding protein
MSDVVIKVEDVSKQYRLGKIGTGTFSHDMNRWWHTVRGKEDPYLKIGAANDRSKKSDSDYVWALTDVSFDVKQGEVVGIIGRNGAGKSTLLKILSRTTLPTMGSIKIKGRVASLLEVGTGFHPELTGRENIFLNGAILGMRKSEIKKQFDEIVDFSGVEAYIDTPVKRYSSGMYVRLAFAVAAHLDPEILIVDEVLAVGDAEFQKKCLGKMQDASREQGRTVLFVSHNMSAVSSLCTIGVVLENGRITYKSSASECIDYYMKNVVKNVTEVNWHNQRRPGDDVAQLISARLISKENDDLKNARVNEEFGVEIVFEVLSDETRLFPNIHVFSKKDDYLFVSGSGNNDGMIQNKGVYCVKIWISNDLLNEGGYSIGIAVSSFSPVIVHFYEKHAIVFDVVEEDYNKRSNDYINKIPGFFRPQLKWEIENNITIKGK